MAKRSSYGDLVKIEKHPYYFENPISKKIIYRKSVNGTPVKISTGVTSISEAKKIVDLKLIELFAANPAQAKREKKGIKTPLVKDVWQELMDERSPQRHKHTVDGYWKEWNHGFGDFFKSKTVAHINDGLIRSFENWYLANKGERTFFNTHKYLTMLLRYCEQKGYIKPPRPTVNDLDEVIRTKTKKEDVGRVYTDDEVTGILKNSLSYCETAIYFGRYLGMRKMEILTMEWRLINFKDKTMKVWSMKNKKWREVPLPEWLVDNLKDWKEVCGSDKWLFPAAETEGAHISSQVFDKAWKRAQKHAGISNWNVKNAARFHDLRHTFATQTAIDGWPILLACEMLDMSVEEYQKTYAHVGSFDIRKAMNKSMKKPGAL